MCRSRADERSTHIDVVDTSGLHREALFSPSKSKCDLLRYSYLCRVNDNAASHRIWLTDRPTNQKKSAAGSGREPGCDEEGVS